ncbi:MAG TPA: flagellar motor switch protein FliN [Noviherbaspirillum sp.]|nr:flagellar motor switch protein FliN [Noviherbaspirillum sp.]
MKETEQQHSTQIIELSEIRPQTPSGSPVLGGNIGLLQGVKVKLSVVLGEAHTTLGELMDLKEASVLKIDRQVDHPVDVLVEGNVVARGQLVVVDDNFGVRITEIAAPA